MKKLFLQHKHRHILFAIVLQLFVLFAVAQVRISGKVTSAEGTGIPGISVSVKNTNFGTATDPSGNYDLNANCCLLIFCRENLIALQSRNHL